MTLKELRSRMKTKQTYLKTLSDKVQKENRSMTKDEILTFDAEKDKIETLKRQIITAESMPESNETPAEVRAWGVDEKKEFRTYLRTGINRRAVTGQSNNSNPDGKFLNPNAFSNELFTEITSDSGILSLMRSMMVTSDKLEFPTVDDSGTGKALDIKQGAELDPVKSRKLAIANVEIILNTYAVETVISNQLREDNAVNLESVVAELGASGIARNASKDAFTVLETGLTIASSAVSAVIGYLDLVTLMGSVNGRYYEKAKWVMSQANFIKMLGLEDTNKRPILLMPIENGMKPSILGKPVTIDDNAGENIYFGDFNTVILAQNQNTSTLIDMYSLSSDLATKYITSARMGAGLLSTKAVAGMKPKT